MGKSFVPQQLYDHHLSAAHPFWMGMGEGLLPVPAAIHVHNGLEIGITLAGLIEFRFGQFSVTMGSGGVGLCGMWEPHQASMMEPAGNSQIVVIFLPEFLASSPRDAAPWMRMFAVEPDERPQVRSPRAREAVLAIGHQLCDELDGRPPQWEEMVRLDLLRLLLVLEREWEGPLSAEAGPELYPAVLGRVMPAVTLVHADLAHRVSCAEAAAACGFSEPHFRSLFRRVMGIGFGGFSLRARLGFAAHCLASTGLPLQQVVEATGFADLSHFHRVFERHFGCNPTDYREQSRTAPPPMIQTDMGTRQRFTSRAAMYEPGSARPPRPPEH